MGQPDAGTASSSSGICPIAPLPDVPPSDNGDGREEENRNQDSNINNNSNNNNDISTDQGDVECPPNDNDNDENTEDDKLHYQKTCRFVARMGWYACHYGATPSRVEVLLSDLMHHFGYTGSLFRITNGELICVFGRDKECIFDDQLIRIFALNEGLHLHRLGLLNEVCKQVCQGTLSQSQALQALEDIEHVPNPWGVGTFMLSFVLVGATVPAILQGSWWDALGGFICSILVYALLLGLPPLYHKALPLLSTFVSAMVAFGLQRSWIPQLQVEIVVLSAVIVQVPGYWVSLAVSEIISNHITAGMGRLVNSLVTLGLLVGGYWLAYNIKDVLADDSNEENDQQENLTNNADTDATISVLWQNLFFVPCLMMCLCIQFQTSPSDCPWSFMNLMVAYGTSYAATLVAGKRNIGVLLASMAVTVFAQVWARWKDRPRSIVITPALVILVGGSIGFRGLVNFAVEDDKAGLYEFAQMFVIALLIVAGLLIGNVLVRAPTTL